MPYSLCSGEKTSILQNIAYALPPKVVFLLSSVALESSADGTTFAALTGANTTGVNCGGAWIRCPTAPAVVICKKIA